MDDFEPQPTHQKVSLWVFVVIGLTTLVFGVLRLQKTIFLPFVRKPAPFAFKSIDELEKERTEAMKTTDTDHDGLMDYDELYVFRTSPFLEDSDSDGTPDGTEVQGNSDPNCPRGKECRQQRKAPEVASGASGDTAAGGSSAPSSAGADAVLVIAETFGDLSALTQESIDAKLKDMSAADVRDFLEKLGVPPLALDKSDDKTLRDLTRQTLVEIAAAVQKQGGTTSGGDAAAPASANDSNEGDTAPPAADQPAE